MANSGLNNDPAIIELADANGNGTGQFLGDSPIPVSGTLSSAGLGFVSTVNSSTAPLGVSGVFTGGWEQVKDYAIMTFSVISNVASANNGISFQWSSDGTNVDRSEGTSLTAGVGRAFSVTIRARYFRIVFTNGTTAQTSFRMQSIYKATGYGHISKPVDGSVTGENFAELVQSTLLGRKSDDSYVPIDYLMTIAGQLALPTISHPRVSFETINDRMFVTTGSVFLTANATEFDSLLLRNPSGSGKRIYLYDWRLGVINTSTQVTWRFYKLPTVTTVGTAQTVTNRRIGSNVASSMSMYLNPTISNRGSLFERFVSAQNQSTQRFPVDFSMTIEDGFDVLITGLPTGNNTSCVCGCTWAEGT